MDSYARNTCGFIQLHASLCVSMFTASPVSVSHNNFKLFCHQTPILHYNGTLQLSNHILMRGWIVEGKLLFSSFYFFHSLHEAFLLCSKLPFKR